jgi:hypothetical protein
LTVIWPVLSIVQTLAALSVSDAPIPDTTVSLGDTIGTSPDLLEECCFDSAPSMK